jgi:carbamoyl-phosphate synthase small subunit
LGNQLVSLALGARTYKLKFGHRGGNHPVKNLLTGRVDITSQNHGYAVDRDSLAGTGLELTHINLNDGTVEGVRHRDLRVITLQYHPEAAPGPWDSRPFFNEFLALMDGRSA